MYIGYDLNYSNKTKIKLKCKTSIRIKRIQKLPPIIRFLCKVHKKIR